MKEITYRELQTRLPDELPVLITRYGKPYMKLVPVDTEDEFRQDVEFRLNELEKKMQSLEEGRY